MPAPSLLSPIRLGPLTLPNRVVMAPLTRLRADMPGNLPNAMMEKYYEQRAEAGLIVSEATPISATGDGYYGTPHMRTDAQEER
ncbi:MAG: alkene reductase, partial [Armatimonadota bacterium]